ncbi:MAG: glycosyltransferase family 2 protein [Lachnospiraceae bacterium]|nr:glycosyltransferase family 2 protein [Lachnospiraceae bacterium]
MITVLLAAWQGAAYIEEQLDSILNQVIPDQAVSDWKLRNRAGSEGNDSEPWLKIMVSDDGSVDGTREILERYRENFQEQVLLKHRSAELRAKDLEDGIPAAAGNFFWLLSQADDDYVMLSDQDDVWKGNKAERLLVEMERLEKLHGKDHPILVHSDMEVVDGDLKVMHPSFFAYQKCRPERTSFAELLVENSVTGGAVMMNRALVELLKERPAACFMHDWWIALAAACFGEISCVRESLYLYRQHGSNTLGAKETGSVKDVAERLDRTAQVEENYRKMAAQAHAFGKMYEKRMSEEQKATLRAYLALRYQSPVGRFKNIVKNRFFKSSRIQTLAQCVTIPRPDGGNWPI